MADNWEGAVNPDRHHSVGERAWCQCSEWCYEHDPCSCCYKWVREYENAGTDIPDQIRQIVILGKKGIHVWDLLEQLADRLEEMR